MGMVERKLLGALLKLCNDEMIAKATLKEIADEMGYATVGGAMTFAIRLLETNNHIRIVSKGKYEVLL